MTKLATAAAPAAPELTAAQIQQTIANTDTEIQIARSEEQAATLRVQLARGKSAAGANFDESAEAALVAAKRRRVELEQKRADLEILAPVAEYRELLAQREAAIAARAAQRATFTKLHARLTELDKEREEIEPQVRRLREIVGYPGTDSIDKDIAKFVAQHGTVLAAAGVAIVQPPAPEWFHPPAKSGW